MGRYPLPVGTYTRPPKSGVMELSRSSATPTVHRVTDSYATIRRPSGIARKEADRIELLPVRVIMPVLP